jgi:hypothetical protein
MSVRKTFLVILAAVSFVGIVAVVKKAVSAYTQPPHVPRASARPPKQAAAPAPIAPIVVAAETPPSPPAEAPEPVAAVAEAPPTPEPRKILKGERMNMIEQVHIAQVVNLTPVADESVEVSEGAVCDARGYGTMTVVGLDGDRVLVRYHRAVRQKARLRYADEEAGQYPDCPSGTLFFITTDHYRKIARPMETAKVEALLKQER